MSKKKISILMAAILLCVSLTGCTSMISLTEDEEEEIAIYTSTLISKYNRNQTNGITYISEQKQIEIEETEASYHPEDSEEPTEEPEVESGDTAVDEDLNLDLDALDATVSDDADAGSTTQKTNTEDEVSGESITLAELVNKSGLSVSYQGATAATHYTYSEVLDISPTKGYQFLVMTFQLKNTTSSAVSLNMGDMNLKFRATVGGVTAKADQTFLPDEFATFEGSIPAGGSQNVVLLFQYPSNGLSDLSNLSLRVVQGGNTYTVVL